MLKTLILQVHYLHSSLFILGVADSCIYKRDNVILEDGEVQFLKKLYPAPVEKYKLLTRN